MPYTHAVQALSPEPVLYLPPGHCVQPVAVEKVPASHHEHAVAPALEYWPTAQLAHAVAVVSPTPEENLPAKHCVHVDPTVPVKYAPPAQSTQALAPTSENSPEAQLAQAAKLVPVEYLPAAQPVHDCPATEE